MISARSLTYRIPGYTVIINFDENKTCPNIPIRRYVEMIKELRI